MIYSALGAIGSAEVCISLAATASEAHMIAATIPIGGNRASERGERSEGGSREETRRRNNQALS